MTFDEYCVEVEHARVDAPAEWRDGHVAMDVLRQVRPDLHRAVAGRTLDLDPMWIDGNMPAFTEFLRANWDVRPP